MLTRSFVGLLLLSWVTGYSQPKPLSLYFIGDAGALTVSTNGLKELIDATVDSSTEPVFVFLGDNIYPKGMPQVGGRDRDEAEAIMRAQIDLVEKYDAPIFFIPGNHDWKKGNAEGWAYVTNQQQFIDSLNNPNIRFLPSGGCPGPIEINLNDDVVLVIVDSQWMLHRWDKPVGDDSPCDVKSSQDLIVALADVLDRNRDKRIIIATHHPIYTNGEHGGVFTLRDHLFPLTELNHNLYIPLPVAGSLYPLYRKMIGDIQDVNHPIQRQYRKVVTSLLSKYPGAIHVSGHEHALQSFFKDSVQYITSGAGVKNSFVKMRIGSEYVSRNQGFVRIDIHGQDADIDFFEVGRSKTFSKKLPAIVSTGDEDENRIPDFSKTITTHASDRYEAGRTKKKWLGANYRQEWKQDLEVPLFNIGEEHGGLKIVQRGGGMQTLSLRLEDSEGNQFTLRSVEKYPEKAIPTVLHGTFASDLVQDQISAAHPYGALVVPYLAEAAGIYHTNPRLVYIPDDPRFGVYRKTLANTLMLFEERPHDASEKQSFFGNSKNIVGSDKVIEQLAKDNDNQVDQKFVLRSRLFDMIIGDWDRHDDQWRWAVFEEKHGERYRPIPRDRDQAFFVGDGKLARLYAKRWALPKFEGFHDEVWWAPGFMFNGRYFDRHFLTELDADDWKKVAEKLQSALTDDVIESSIRKFPPEIFNLHGEEIIRKLKSRRDHLQEYALQHYRFLSREVTLTGSNKHELFEVEHLKDGDVEVKIFKIQKDGDVERKIYERTFHPGETKEICLFGFDGKDIFKFKGESKGKIKIRVIGGGDSDEVKNKSDLRVVVYDKPKGIDQTGDKLIDRTSKDRNINAYDRRAFKYPLTAPLIYLNYNYDDGIFLGGGLLHTNHGFRKTPFKSRHVLLASYAPYTTSYNFKYKAIHNQVFGKVGLDISVDVKAPNFVNNFFGWGNETVFDSDINKKPGYDLRRPIDYYRIRFQQIELEALLRFPVGKRATLKFGPRLQRAEIELPKTDQSFVEDYNGTLSESLFDDPKIFDGLVAEFNADFRDNARLPTRGILFDHRSEFMNQASSAFGKFTSHNASLAVYQSFRLPARVTFALRVGGGINTGDYQLYQAQVLDGKTELRGYRKTRFYGDRRFYNNNEIRFKLGSFRSYLFPASFGINTFFDAGRVWYKDENGIDPSTASGESSLWHYGYGGGIWATPFNMAALSVEFAHSSEGTMLYVRLGFLF